MKVLRKLLLILILLLGIWRISTIVQGRLSYQAPLWADRPEMGGSIEGFTAPVSIGEGAIAPADAAEAERLYGIELVTLDEIRGMDAVVIAVTHTLFGGRSFPPCATGITTPQSTSSPARR